MINRFSTNGLALMLLLTGCVMPVPMPVQVATTDLGPKDWSGCGVKVEFASYAMGIDQGALSRMRVELDTNWPETRIFEHLWGREGEVSWCVLPKRMSDSPAMAARLRSMIPEKPRGPITVELIAKR